MSFNFALARGLETFSWREVECYMLELGELGEPGTHSIDLNEETCIEWSPQGPFVRCFDSDTGTKCLECAFRNDDLALGCAFLCWWQFDISWLKNVSVDDVVSFLLARRSLLTAATSRKRRTSSSIISSERAFNDYRRRATSRPKQSRSCEETEQLCAKYNLSSVQNLFVDNSKHTLAVRLMPCLPPKRRAPNLNTTADPSTQTLQTPPVHPFL